MELVGPLDINYCIYFNLLSIIGVLLCMSSLLVAIIYPKKWIYIIYFTILYFMVFFQNRLLYNMCASKKEGLLIIEMGSVIDNINKYIGKSGDNTHIANIFNDIIKLSETVSSQQMTMVVYSMKKADALKKRWNNEYTLTTNLGTTGDTDTDTATRALYQAPNTKPENVTNFFNHILDLVKANRLTGNENTGVLLNYVIDLINDINAKLLFQSRARMPYDVVAQLNITGNTWSEYYPAIQGTLNLIDHKLNTIKTNTAPLSYTQTYRPVNH